MSYAHLFYELRMLADDALSMVKFGKYDLACNTLTDLISMLEEEYEHACDEAYPDIPDDVDESNYNPYTGCDEYEDIPIDCDGEDLF